MTATHHVHLDCDIGIDDALALAHLLSRPDFYQHFYGERDAAPHDPLASMIAVGDSIPSAVHATALSVDPSAIESRAST